MVQEQTKTQVRRGAEETARPTFLVTIVSGPERGQSFQIDADDATRSLIGQSPACTTRLSDPLVSRRHLAFDVEDEGLRLTDLGSKNGTVVNGMRVVEVILTGGEVVRLGSTCLRVDRITKTSMQPKTHAMSFGRVVGGSREMRRLYPMLEQLADADVPVIIEGETGTGKELLAEALHEAGPRPQGPFIVFDCTALTGPIAAASLFGRVPSSAASGKVGAFEQARGGTLLIDEISELDPAAQAKLLRALERRQIQREGDSEWTTTDVRLLVSSRRDLDAEVVAGRLRDDLYHRLAAARVELPPLRKRQGDVALLTRHFWRTFGGGDLAPTTFMERLDDYAWPGNVRELHNVVAHRFALGEASRFDPEGVEAGVESFDPAESMPGGPDAIERVLERELPFTTARAEVVAVFERRYVTRLLAKHKGSVARAAAAAGIARRYFQILRGRQK